MSKRLKFAKLRLAKPIDPPGDPAPPVTGPAEANACADSMVNGKISKYFAKQGADACVKEDTFIVIHSEDSGEDNDAEKREQCSRRRPQTPPEACPKDGPKLPKLRKKTCEGNVLISNFLASQPSQHAEEDDDFEEIKVGSPKSQYKPTKVQRTTGKKPKAKAPKRPKNQADIRKVLKKYKNDHEVLQELLKEHSASEQIDPEQLQMALAMSRSLADLEYSEQPTTSAALPPSNENGSIVSSSGSSEERRIVSIRTTLEQFGFRCKNSYTDYDLNVIFGSAGTTKNVKKIKHKRATNLQPRSREELSTFIVGKAKKLFPLVMIEKTSEEASVPLDLENVQSYFSNLFWIAQTERPSEELMEKYYVPELLEAVPAPVGCMLKDWSKIPGRECTPEREIERSQELEEAVEKKNNHGTEAVAKVGETEPTNDRVSSPDLFDNSEVNIDNYDNNENQRVENEPDTKIEQNEEETPHPLIEDSIKRGLHEKEVSNTCEELPANEEPEIMDGKSPEAVTDGGNKQALENIAVSTGSGLERAVSEDRKDTTQMEVIVLDDDSEEEEEEQFVTAPEMSECPQSAFHQSSENIFEDSDQNPMVSFEVYSSEEEKISAASQAPVGTVSANGDLGIVDQVLIGDVQQADGMCNTAANTHQNVLNGEESNNLSRKVEISTSPCVKGLKFLPEKDLSFNRLAIKARLSEANTLETVDLVDGALSSANPTPNLEEDVESVIGTQCSQQQNDTQDDVLYISDDEVNYSIGGKSFRVRDIAPIGEEDVRDTGKEEDPDMTITYAAADVVKTHENDANDRSLSSDVPPCSTIEPEILTISSNENDSEPVVAEVNCAESTFAYLDNLVKEFNLPPLKTQPSGTVKASRSLTGFETPSAKDLNDGNQRLSVDIVDDNEKELENGIPIAQQNVPVVRNHVPSVFDELSNYLNNYEEPIIDDHEIAAEMMAPQQPPVESAIKPGPEIPSSSKALSRVKSCTQFDSPRISSPLRRTPSETVLRSSSTPKEKDAFVHPPEGGGFEGKFNELKKAVIDVGPAEYVISTLNVSQHPPEYGAMSTPEIERELFKYGLKSLQRSKGIRVLNYLFESMHPHVVVEERKDENLQMDEFESIPIVSQAVSKKKCKQTPTPGSATVLKRPRKCAFKLDTSTTDYFLPSKPRKKMAWCAVPLHISFFNLVSECETLQRQILRYEPINLDVVYGTLKEGGLRYETNDLIAFLDKHCITFRTASSSGDRTAKGRTKDGGK